MVLMKSGVVLIKSDRKKIGFDRFWKLGCGSALAVVFFVTNWHEFCSLLNTWVKTQITDPQKRVVDASVGAKTQRKICENALSYSQQLAASSSQSGGRNRHEKIIFINR